MKLTYLWLLGIFMLSTCSLQAQNKQPKIAIEPSWITKHSLEYNSTNFDQQAEDGYVDLDYERQASLVEQSTYYKVAYKILSEIGVQNRSKISIEYDPSYEQLIFHSIRIIRGSTSINKLEPSKIKVLQQEKDLDRYLYNGSISAILILEDVRAGDILEYSYSIKGMNPIFGGKYADKYKMQFSVPVGHAFYKLIVPQPRQITIKNLGTNLQPTIQKTLSETIYEWNLTNLTALKLEDDVPQWFDPYPEIQVSEYKNWKEVSDWALGLFDENVLLSLALQGKINEIKNKNNTLEGRTIAALRFIQDEIRYMGIEMGTGSHKPHDPNLVFSQRFGDCKDKSYLLCVMLRAMGIEADPVLINTTDKKSINHWLPSATAFDHVTVRARIGNNYYWFDPTISNQRGTIKDISFPDYQTGLIINAQTTNLTPIPLQDNGIVNIREVFKVPDMSGSASLIVTTSYTGSFADNIRSQFKSNSLSSLQKSFVDFYRSYWSKITLDSLTHYEDEKTGMFITTEYYKLKEFWGTASMSKKAEFEPYVLNGILKTPKNKQRTMPFTLIYPAHYLETIEVQLPEKWDAKESLKKIEHPAFTLSTKYSKKGNKVFMEYAYESQKDFISIEEMQEFLNKMKEGDENLAYSLTKTIEEPDTRTAAGTLESNYLNLYILLGLCVSITVMVRRNRNSR